MKKRNLFLTLGLSLTLGLGVAAGVATSLLSAKESEPVEVQAAADTKIFLDLGNTGWGGKSASIYVHYWGGTTSTTWPGLALTKNEYGLYTGLVDGTSTGLKFHVGENWKNDCETGDLTFNASKMLWKLTSGTPATAASSAVSEKDVYVLDLYGDSLDEYHQVHAWKAGGYSTAWPGITMDLVAGTSSLYKATILGDSDKIIINDKHGAGNNEGYQTEDLDYSSKVFVLDEFNKTPALISVEAATFIAKYMHMDYDKRGAHGSTAGTNLCLTYYEDARDHFDALDADDKADVNSISIVKTRLADWKAAYDANNASGTFVLTKQESGNNPLIIVLVSTFVIAVIAGGLLLLRKKRLNSDNL